MFLTPLVSESHRPNIADVYNKQAADGADTHACEEETRLPTKPILRPFQKIPSELRLRVAEYAVQNHYDSIIAESETGEKLEDIWIRVHNATPSNKLTAIESATQDFNTIMVWHGSLNARYNFHSQLPSILHLNHDLREEGREAFGNLAKEMLALAEAQHRHNQNTFSDDYHTWFLKRTVRRSGAFGSTTITRDDVSKAKKEMYRSAADMVSHTLRWHVLRQTCELLELQP